MSDPGATVLDVQHVVAGYGDQRVLDDVSLAVERGEIGVRPGGSGSGKSTLLRCIVGLLAPWSGRVLLNGHDVNAAEGLARDAILRDVGMAFQSAALLNSMTVGENVALPVVEHWHVDQATARMIARMRLARVGLGRAGDKMPSELSGGMRKRAGLARALVMEPEIILFDEPTTGLDPLMAKSIHDLIISMHRRFKFTAVMVSHEIPEIFGISDWVAMLKKGKIAEMAPAGVFSRTTDPEIREFISVGGTVSLPGAAVR